MRFKTPLRILTLALLSLSFAPAPAAQQRNCPQPAAVAAPSEPNIFNEEQEAYLGEAIAERIQKDYRIIEDSALTDYLARVGARLAEQLPLKATRFRFFVVDMPDANAFVLPGGRVYVSRKLIALARNEDELAGVIAHELGHLATHETAIDMTRRLKEVLGVTAVTDRRDVFEKYNQLMDNFRRKPGAYKSRDREERGQVNADQIGFYALVAAGYDPEALSRFWDRMTETQGKTGGFISDLFGTTRPEEKRLREMLKALSSLPASCTQKRADSRQEEFTRWQSAVVSYTGLGRREALHGVLLRRQLSPPLRGDIAHLRFSPDGRYVLAQDESSITVLSREPFAPLFRVEAERAKPASFTPDSQTLLFYTDNLRVERWSVAEQRRLDAKELVIFRGCLQTTLSPDGRLLACLDPHLSLNLVDVASGQTVAQRKKFFLLGNWRAWGLMWQLANADDNTDLGLDVIKMGFSPDGRYFLAGTMGRDNISYEHGRAEHMALDTTTMQKVPLPGSIEKLLLGGFTFFGDGRMVGVNYYDRKKSALVTFPEGKVLAEFTLGGTLEAATRGDYVFVRPTQKYALGVLDLSKKIISKVNEQPAMDIFGDIFVAEMRNGQVGIFSFEKNELIAAAQLPDSTIGRLDVADLSPDLKWLAMSGDTRGGVWNTESGEAAFYLRGFRGAHFDGKSFYGEFPKFEEAERNVARFDLASGEIVPGRKIESEAARQIGKYLVGVVPAKGEKQPAEGEEPDWRDYRRNVRLELAEAATSKALWSKVFPKESPVVWVSPREGLVALVWDVSADAARDIIKADPSLSSRLASMKEKQGDYLIQLLDAQTGERKGEILLETGKGSFRLRSIFSAGEWVVMADTLNRVHVYSLKTGEQKGRVFGSHAAVSQQKGLLCVENESGKLAIYDIATMEKRDELVFSNPLAMARFSADGQRLFVLTANQTAYVFDASSMPGPSAAAR